MAGDPAVVWVLDFNLCARAVVPPSSVDLTHTWGGYRILTGQVTRSHLLTKLLLFYIAETGKMLQAIRGLHSCAYWISHHREVCGKKNLLSRRQKRSIREGENFFFYFLMKQQLESGRSCRDERRKRVSLLFPFHARFHSQYMKEKVDEEMMVSMATASNPDIWKKLNVNHPAGYIADWELVYCFSIVF